MSQIPAPLLSRHTAIAVVVLAVLGAAAGLLPLLVAPGDPGALALAVVARLVLALDAGVLALAALLAWRTLTRPSRFAVDTPVAVVGGFLLLALAQVAWALQAVGWLPEDWSSPIAFGALLGIVLAAAGLVALGAGVLLLGVWRGPTRYSLFLSALLLVLAAWAAASAPLAVAAGAVALASASFLGLAIGLRSRRPVANAGVPQGAARA